MGSAKYVVDKGIGYHAVGDDNKRIKEILLTLFDRFQKRVGDVPGVDLNLFDRERNAEKLSNLMMNI